MEPIPIVYLAAGMSKRFGSRIKQLAIVGPNNETFIEYSVLQALRAGFKKIIFVVSENTEKPIQHVFQNNYKGIPVHYVKQTFSKETRDNPWGTLSALCAAKPLLDTNFVVCNGDDLYGESTFRLILNDLQEHGQNVTIGYPLLNVLPEEGTVNRGIFEIENDKVVCVREEIGISKENFSSKGIPEQSLCSMNIFGITTETFAQLHSLLEAFRKTHKGNRTIECYLPVELGKLIKEKKIEMKLLTTSDKWIGITNPGDELQVKKELQNL